MKSESGSEPLRKWKLKRTLRRNNEHRPVEEDDLRYLWAAYKQGALESVAIPTGLGPGEFSAAVDAKLSQHARKGWAMLRDGKPVGFVFGAPSPFNTFMEISLVVWMPWASNRTIIESAIAFISKIRKEGRFIGCAIPQHKKLYEVAAMHGLVRRIGTSYNVIPGHATAIFESRHKE